MRKAKKLRIPIHSIAVTGPARGTVDATVPAGGLPWATLEDLHIGADPGCGIRTETQGRIDEVRIYDRALNAADVAEFLATPRSVPALVIAGHGITAWGDDLAAAHRHVEITEFLCRLELARRGQPHR